MSRNIFTEERYKTQQFNALNVADLDAHGTAWTGIDGTARSLSINVCAWRGYILHNNVSAARWVQVYCLPAADVVPGTTVPDFTIMLGASASVAWDFYNPIISEKGFSFTATSTEVGIGSVTTAVTGVLLYAEQGVV